MTGAEPGWSGQGFPDNWPDVVAELAYHHGWTPAVLDAMTAAELWFWHSGLTRLAERHQGGGR